MRSRALAALAACALLLTLVPSTLAAAIMSPTTGPNTGGTLVSITGGSGYNVSTSVQITCGTTPHTVAPTSVSASGESLTFVTPSVAPFVGLCAVATLNPATPDLPAFTFTGTGPTGPTSKEDCKHGGWQSFTDPAFKNQGNCLGFVRGL